MRVERCHDPYIRVALTAEYDGPVARLRIVETPAVRLVYDFVEAIVEDLDVVYNPVDVGNSRSSEISGATKLPTHHYKQEGF